MTIEDLAAKAIMAIDPKGNRGVSRAPMPTHGFECLLCHDSGTHMHTGEWAFCLCPAGIARLAANPQECEEANAILANLERKTAKR